MEFLMMFIGFLVWMLFIVGTSKAISYVKKKQLTSNWKQLGPVKTVPAVDEQGYRAEYDPHYTRLIEKEQGLRVETQCGMEECTICYWKARTLSMPGNMAIIAERQKFIDELPDGLSDELYDSMLEDWQISMRPVIEANEKKESARKEERKRQEDEDFYATPYALIHKYKAEGRVFNKQNNSWSSPSVEHMLDDKEKALLSRNKAHWAKRHPNHYKPKLIEFKPKPEDQSILDVYDHYRNIKDRQASFGVRIKQTDSEIKNMQGTLNRMRESIQRSIELGIITPGEGRSMAVTPEYRARHELTESISDEVKVKYEHNIRNNQYWKVVLTGKHKPFGDGVRWSRHMITEDEYERAQFSGLQCDIQF